MVQGDQRVTLQRIAAAAGVSVSTVSRALSDAPGIAAATRARIADLSREHGYRRTERVRHTGDLIHLVLGDLGTPWAMDLIRGVEREAARRGTAVVVATHHGSRRAAALDVPPAAGAPAGIIVDTPALAPAAAGTHPGRRPVVVVDPAGDVRTALPVVTVAAWTDGWRATDCLLAAGHRRIAVLAGPPDQTGSHALMSGCRVALEAAGLTPDPGLLRHGGLRHESGLHETARLLALDTPPTAILAGSPALALGALEAVRRHGLRVPTDVSVVGIGGQVLAQSCSPPLTTVRQPYAEMGELAVRMLDGLAAGTLTGPARVELGGELVHRDSVAAPPAGHRAVPRQRLSSRP